jgi:hypothetical protein
MIKSARSAGARIKPDWDGPFSLTGWGKKPPSVAIWMKAGPNAFVGNHQIYIC